MARPENPFPAGENRTETPGTTRGSERWIDREAIAVTALAVGLILAGGVLGGATAGECGAYAGGIVGLTGGLALAARFSDSIHPPSIHPFD